MQNYHRHTCYSNIFTPDSATKNEEYAKRAVELGHKIISSVEHGFQGYYFETFELAKKYNLKCVIGAEAYWVKDRQKEYSTHTTNKNGEEIFQKDKSNHHIIILAKNNNGREALNDILSEASITGYYYKPRVDLDLLLSLPPEDVFITSACIAFSGYDDIDDIILKLHNHFKNNFMLEIQYHNTDKQKEWNRHLWELSKKYNIELIVGLDSHYIYESEAELRDIVLDAKEIHYEDEEGWYMDYPDDETVMKRFLEQGIFDEDTIRKAMNNTDVCLTFDDYDNIPIFNKEIKLPTLYPGKSKEEKDKIYSKLISRKFKEYMKNIPPEEYNKYFEGIKMEVQTYKDTGMSDYPLIDYAIVNDAIEHGGLITDTGRGSAVGYMTNTLCGFSKVDRFKSAIKLYPERFISTTRILETHSLPDIDLNVGTVDIFEESQKRVLGDDHAVPMIAFGTLKKKSAFKLYAKAKGMDFSLANTISEQISKYDEAIKNADDDERDTIDIYDYIDEKYKDYIDQSQEYWGIISDKKKAPSAYLLYQGSIRREIGLIKCKSESTKKEYITCVIDGAIAENYKFLKNDILKVDVVLLIDKVFKRIGIKHFDVNTLIDKIKDDKEFWNLYANGYTIGVNQVEQDGSRHKCMNYKPQNISELSAFIAAIRPGFKSMYDRFEKREDFKWGIPSLDNLLRTEELPVSFLFFQEQVMSVLNYAGFPMDECYGIIKAIAKKHPEKVRPLKQRFIDGFRNKLIEDEQLSEEEAQKNAEDVWVIINDNCGYGFNCVSGSTKIIKGGNNSSFNPTIEEMYKIRHDKQYAKNTGHYNLYKKYNSYGYGMALSLCEDNRLRLNRIVGIKEAGIRQTYEVTTKSGCSLICTDNHKFPTPYGELKLKELKVGDKLFCKGNYKHKYFDTSFTDGDYELNYPKKGQCGFQKKEDGNYAIYNAAIIKHRMNEDSCEYCGKKYSTTERFELHHKDFNRHNNCNNNYQWLCCSCHKKIHYENGRTKRYENGIETYLDEIISIVPKDIEMVYDIEMDDPYHTFVSESGLVTSNSAHAFCMALDSSYQAWLKVHYPYEFYEVLLQHYSDKGNKKKVSLLKQEMKKAFGISEGHYRFRVDNRSFVADKDNKRINPALSSIKGLSYGLSEKLYDIRDEKFNSFVDLLKRLKEIKVSSDQLDILIKIGYFEEFGNINFLLTIVKYFNLLYDRKQIDYNFIEKNNIPLWIIQSCAKTQTEKMFKNFDSIELINKVIYELGEIKTSIVEKMKYQNDLLGYVDLVLPKTSKEYYYVSAINGSMITLYQLCSGDTLKIKIRSNTMKNSPFFENDIIKVLEINQEKKFVKNPDGTWGRKDELENILSKYLVLKK